MRAMKTSAAPIEMSAWSSVRRAAASRSRSAAPQLGLGPQPASSAACVVARTPYPAASVAPTSSARPASAGSKLTVARSVARLTRPSATPGVLRRNRSMRLTQDAQVMPSTGRTSSVGPVGASVRRGIVGSVAFIIGYYRGIPTGFAPAAYLGPCRASRCRRRRRRELRPHPCRRRRARRRRPRQRPAAGRRRSWSGRSSGRPVPLGSVGPDDPAALRRAASVAERARTAVEAYLAGDASALEAVPMRPWHCAPRSAWRSIGRSAGPRRTGRFGVAAGRLSSAARAVGGAVGRNPIGLFVPCHRVIAGDGSAGVYGGDACRAAASGRSRSSEPFWRSRASPCPSARRSLGPPLSAG